MKYFKQIEDSLVWSFEFANFQNALEFVNLVWNIAEISNHHPDIKLHDYKYVEIKTTTHDARNTITEKDNTLAQRIEDSYKK